MSEKLVAQLKSFDSKRAIKAKRKTGLIPVNLYGPGIENSHSYYMNEIDLNRAIKSGKKIHEITSEIGDFNVVMKEVQRHPVSWKLVHVDLLSLAQGMKVTVTVPVRYEGVPFGVKNMGGVFIINSRDIRIEALAEHIPNEIIVDVEQLKLKDTIHASDIVRENIKVVSPGGMLLSRVGITRAAVSAGAEVAEVAPVAAAPAAAQPKAAPGAGGASKSAPAAVAKPAPPAATVKPSAKPARK
ncbi:MAG: 50S ribosomal protein L25 [Candidatus Delongbacteria bacterium]|nr:50S ribosomal protein L25 [Candidatus Delongbacteria bacterium]MCG2760685.1 50S ribosomal protein L25 [Candidatus Delongbacteria bacterium]